MKILEENQIYTNDDLADWFGIKPASFRTYKKQKLETLKLFADFEEVGRGKILITKVEEPIFVKGKKKEYNNNVYKGEIFNLIEKYGCYQNCANITRGIKETRPEVLEELKHNSYHTAYAYVRNNVKEMYNGTYGYRSKEHTWCKAIPIKGDFCRFVPMTKEEYEDWKKIRRDCQQYCSEEADEIEFQYYNGEITMEEAQSLLGTVECQWRFVISHKIFKEKYGYKPIPGYEFVNSGFINET